MKNKEITLVVIAIGVIGLIIAYYTYQATQQQTNAISNASGSLEDTLSSASSGVGSFVSDFFNAATLGAVGGGND